MCVSSTRDHLYEFFAEHASADSVQEKVNSDSSDVQQFRVVAGDQKGHGAVAYLPLQLEFDEVDEEVDKCRQIGEHVAGRDCNQHDRRL